MPTAVLDSNYVMPTSTTAAFAFIIQSGGIRFLGADPSTTVLLGNGAWTLKGAYALRGSIAACMGPVTNDAPLVFQNLTFDGGVQVGNQNNVNYPASVTDGSGWDETHDAVMDTGIPPLHANKQFNNCRFVHWRGEILKSVVAMTDGYILLTNCAFLDGDASGYNIGFTHTITGCVFSNLAMAMEFWEGNMLGNSVFENSLLTNVGSGIVIVGALTNHVSPSYTFRNNLVSFSRFGVLFSPARNLNVIGNQFFGGTIGVGTDGAAYQGTDYNSDILVQNNTFTGVGICINVGGAGQDRIVNMTCWNNTASGCGSFANGYGWSSNVVFAGNRSAASSAGNGLLSSAQLTGQWFFDNLSDDLPTNSVTTIGPITNTVTYALGARQQLWSSGPVPFTCWMIPIRNKSRREQRWC